LTVAAPRTRIAAIAGTAVTRISWERLAGTACPPQRADDEITVFDSTGLAVQDLEVTVAVYEDWRANHERQEFVGITEITI
jgi:ornithine cyclodeaminase/alanine dehydrogenase-like protein (mu-crystallin family)